MASSKTTPQNHVQLHLPLPESTPLIDKQHKNTSNRRIRSFSSDDTHALTLYGTNTCGLRQHLINGPYGLTQQLVNGPYGAQKLLYDYRDGEGPLLTIAVSDNNTLVSTLVLESIMNKYDVYESDLDDFDVDWESDEEVEIEELYNLVSFAWNLEKVLEEEETTESLKEYFGLLEESQQKETRRIRSKSTASCDLTSNNYWSEVINKKRENHVGTPQSRHVVQRKFNNKGMFEKRAKGHSNENGPVTHVYKADLEQESKEDCQNNLKNVNDTNDPVKNQKFDVNCTDIPDREKTTSSQETSSTAVNSTNIKTPGNVQDNELNSQSRDLGMVPLATPVWSHDHTYCLTSSPIPNSKPVENTISMVTTESCDRGIPSKLNESREIPNKEIVPKTDNTKVADNRESGDCISPLNVSNETRDIPNKEMYPSVDSSHMESCDANEVRNIPNMEKFPKAENIANIESRDDDKSRDIPKKKPRKGDSVTSEKTGLRNGDKPRDIPKMKTRQDASVTSEKTGLRDGDKPRDIQKMKTRQDASVTSEKIGSRDGDKPRDIPKMKTRQDASVTSKKTGLRDGDKPRDTPKMKTRQDASVTSEKTGLCNGDKPRDIPKMTTRQQANKNVAADKPKSRDCTRSDDANSLNNTAISKTTPTRIQASSSNLQRRPLRSKRTRTPARRRLDTHYY